MLSKNTISIVCNLLKNIAENEKKIEIGRQVLCQNLNFDPYQLFSFIDSESKNYINEINLMTFLNKKNEIPCTLEEMQSLIFLYDENFDSKLSYMEFLNLVLCDNNFELRKKTRMRVGSRGGEKDGDLPFNVEYSMVKLLLKELDLIRTTKKIIKDLKERNDYNVHDLFHYLKGYGGITAESLKLFLEKNMVEFDENDIRYIIKILDINKDSKVDFEEFHSFLCFPNLKCHCCSFCECNCQTPNKTLYNNIVKIKKENSNINSYNINQRKNNKNNINFDINNDSNSFNDNNITKKINFEKDDNNNTYINYPKKPHYSHNFNLIDCQYCQCCPCHCLYMDTNIAEDNFLVYISKLIQCESKIESAKINLISRQDFNIDDAFLIFSNENTKKIFFPDMQKGLKEIGLYIPNEEIILIMKRADMGNKGYLNYEDFIELLVPFNYEFRDKIKSGLNSNFFPKFNKGNIFLLSTKVYFMNLFRTIIECENELNCIKMNTMGLINPQIENIFKRMDVNGFNFINENELLLYLINCGINCSEEENKLIFRRLDKNKDDKIEIWEIEEELSF